MNHTDTLETLRVQYFELSKAFLVALQNNSTSDELEVIRNKIREIVTRMESLESPGSGGSQGPK